MESKLLSKKTQNMVKPLRVTWCKKHRGINKLSALTYNDRGYRARQVKITFAKSNIVMKRYKKSKTNYHLYTTFNITGSLGI